MADATTGAARVTASTHPLPWLEAPSAEDRAALDDRSSLTALPLDGLAALARKRLPERELGRLAGAVRRRLKADGGSAGGPLPRLRICLASQATADLLVDELQVALLRQGFAAELVKPGFNALADLAFGDGLGAGEQARFDFAVVLLDHRQLGFAADVVGDPERAQAELESKLRFVRGVVRGIATKTGGACIVSTLVAPEQVVASIDPVLPGTPAWLVERFNQGLAAFVAETGHILFDAARLAMSVGLANWHDGKMWHLAKIPFAPAVTPLYAHRLSTLVAAARGRSKKVLVFDLDNTLWGGVIGDDGVEGIVLGQGSAAGEAFLELHDTALALKARGVVLAVSSKNTESVARAAFTDHPEMRLKLDDFAVFRANWEDKASNIAHIAKLLDLGLDSFVFLDDNPAERALVRRALPQVSVPEVGADASEYGRTLLAAGYFDSLTFSAEDRLRSQMYRDNASRSSLMEQVDDLSEYLRSLGMVMTIGPVGDASRERSVQLINKSNQFNLTTRRCTVPEMIGAEADPDVRTLQIRLVDTFGDNGIISVVVLRREDDVWAIETWLMSCRVLKRRVEEAVLQHIVEQAQASGVRRLRGLYLPTDRNALVENHYRDLGFARDPASSVAEQVWWLDVDAYETKTLPLSVVVAS